MSKIEFEVMAPCSVISTNFEDVKAQLAEQMRQYEGIVFTEDSKADAKKTVAELRKTKKDIDDRRKEIKRQWMAPYEQFETEVKQLLVLVDKPINYINEQVEAFEQKRLEAREEEIKTIYQEEIGDMDGFLALYRIRSDKWSNASMSAKAIRKEMQETISSARAGKMAIEAMNSDAVPEALRKFQATLNLADALAYINQYEAQQAEILKRHEERHRQEEEQRHQAEIERIRQEERQRIAEEERIRRETEAKTVNQIASVDKERAAELSLPDSHTAVYTVVGTDDELRELEMAMISLGLYYERKDI